MQSDLDLNYPQKLLVSTVGKATFNLISVITQEHQVTVAHFPAFTTEAQFHLWLGQFLFRALIAEPHSSVNSVVDLKTEGRWFDPGSGNILSED